MGALFTERDPPPVAVGELRGKVQGTFFLLGLCVSCDSEGALHHLDHHGLSVV